MEVRVICIMVISLGEEKVRFLGLRVPTKWYLRYMKVMHKTYEDVSCNSTPNSVL
jgi:hypothetical protein